MNQLAEKLIDRNEYTLNGELISFAPISIKKNEGRTLANFIKEKKIESVLEIGLAWGISALYISEALKQNTNNYQHIIIDPYQERHYRNMGIHFLKEENFFEKNEFFEEPSHTVLPKLLERNHAYDLCFIDGFHTFDNILVDFYFCDLLLNLNGYMVFHDTWMPSVRKAINFIKKNCNYIDLKINSHQEEELPAKIYRLGRKIIQRPILDSSGYKFNFENMCFLKKVNHANKRHNDFRNF